jgi:hypothetical protein
MGSERASERDRDLRAVVVVLDTGKEKKNQQSMMFVSRPGRKYLQTGALAKHYNRNRPWCVIFVI